MDENPGYISFSVEGKNSYDIFKNESGGIQWMRFSPTDKKGKVHTSLITVAVLRVPENKEITIKESDIECRFIRAFGSGGQKQQKCETGVIVRHIPSGIESKSTKDRSQHVNKALALDLLRSRFL